MADQHLDRSGDRGLPLHTRDAPNIGGHRRSQERRHHPRRAYHYGPRLPHQRRQWANGRSGWPHHGRMFTITRHTTVEHHSRQVAGTTYESVTVFFAGSRSLAALGRSGSAVPRFLRAAPPNRRRSVGKSPPYIECPASTTSIKAAVRRFVIGRARALTLFVATEGSQLRAARGRGRDIGPVLDQHHRYWAHINGQ
jgi:hypothetical protein